MRWLYIGISRRKVWILAGLALVALARPTAVEGRSSESQFVWISDIHFNPMADPSLVRELESIEAAKWKSVLDRTSPGGFSQYKSDTNWWLLKSALEQFPKSNPHPSFVILTGDLLAHDFKRMFRAATHDEDQQRYREFVVKTVQFLALELQRKFPKTKIFITLGNNDNDCGNYSIEANGAFLHDVEWVARDLAGGNEDFTKSWTVLGFQCATSDREGYPAAVTKQHFLVAEVHCAQLAPGMHASADDCAGGLDAMAGTAAGGRGGGARESVAHVPHSAGNRRLCDSHESGEAGGGQQVSQHRQVRAVDCADVGPTVDRAVRCVARKVSFDCDRRASGAYALRRLSTVCLDGWGAAVSADGACDFAGV